MSLLARSFVTLSLVRARALSLSLTCAGPRHQRRQTWTALARMPFCRYVTSSYSSRSHAILQVTRIRVCCCNTHVHTRTHTHTLVRAHTRTHTHVCARARMASCRCCFIMLYAVITWIHVCCYSKCIHVYFYSGRSTCGHTRGMETSRAKCPSSVSFRVCTHIRHAYKANKGTMSFTRARILTHVCMCT